MRDLAAFALGSTIAAGLATTMAFAPAGGADRTGAGTDAHSTQVVRSAPRDWAPVVPAGMTVPEGWRIETFGRVAFAVPGDWGNTGPTACRGSDVLGRAVPDPAVERPGPVPAIGCPPESTPPSTTVEGGGSFVEVGTVPVDATPEDPAVKDDRASFSVADNGFTVQAEPTLRARILATFVEASGGANGCAPEADVAPGTSPDGPGLNGIGEVESVSACRYMREIETTPIMTPCPFVGCGPTTPAADRPAWLFSSLHLTGAKAQAATDALRSAPIGGTPDAVDRCSPDHAHGTETLLVHVRGTQGTALVQVRYDGCLDRGIDDGRTVRTLTREALAPIITGPDIVMSAHSDVGGVLTP